MVCPLSNESLKRPEMKASVEQHTVDRVCHYLEEELGLEHLQVKLKEHYITDEKLQSLTADDLKNMGIENHKDHLKILNTIKMVLQIKDSPKVFNDSVHGHMEFHPLLVKIIDTPQFQRLRYIKQLGGAYFVYPGASHNRFEHSLGVGYLAGELAQALKTKHDNEGENLIDEKDILSVQIAGLCHDLGHGPFSHMFESVCPKKKLSAGITGLGVVYCDPTDLPCCCFLLPAILLSPPSTLPTSRHRWPPTLSLVLLVTVRFFKHEQISIEMFDYLVEENGLKPLMQLYGLSDPDLSFIKEMIDPKPRDKDGNWPHKGRGEDKSFLYEIVANKTNGVDVDKFDYFARDCHHLGMQNNFDYRRFLKFARVCEAEDGKKHICIRDKEVYNMYDFFHTRYCLHRRAYQHRVNKAIEIMIKDVLSKVKDIKIEGFEKTLLESIDDMAAYTKLTDCLLQVILFSTDENLKEAKEILARICSRDLYVFLGETLVAESKVKLISQKKTEWKKKLAEPLRLKPEDFEIEQVTINYGMKEKNPIEKMNFYNKSDPQKAVPLPKEQVSHLLPDTFSETFIRVYCRKSLRRAEKTQLMNWCKENIFKTLQK
ncbi:deoxynucleoside triphosphate triphosphohydrolase SAMHD1-like isoform X2 [Anabas testudineus]|uniref:deoxynucleoside triphosphate triphosphohydrolase SAMHD1-like isoform X2 n=1 Tax=Anabas testudineus TaxID=64144 RepID=UPI000E466016|nr:deoxynucleoside triphosphate triphosphohydrolase SAMHD1-like isoform X2 [Anabas testudineus]